MLGGTTIIIGPVTLSTSSNVTCVFDSVTVIGARVSNNEALCVSPRLPSPGPVDLNVFIDNEQVTTKDKIFYAREYLDQYIFHLIFVLITYRALF